MIRAKKSPTIICLAIIILVGLFLNTFGLNWGLPEGDWHWDEKVRVLTHMIRDRTLNPHYFTNPALHTYLLGIWLSPYFLIIKLCGNLNGVQSWAGIPSSVKTNIFIMARLFSVFLSIATGYITYLIGKKVWGRLTGIISFAFLILAPGFVTWSHFSTVEITSVFFSTLSFYYCIRIIDKPEQRNYLLAGIFAGLTLSTKYTGWFSGVFILIAHFFSMTKQYGAPKIKNILAFIYSKYLLTALCLMVLSFFITNPFALISFSEFKEAMLGNLGTIRQFAGSKYNFLDWRAIHGLNLIFGTPTLILGILSTFFLAVKFNKKKHHALYLLTSIILYFVYMNSLRWSAPRFLIIILPLIAIAIGHFYASIIKRGKVLKIAGTILITVTLTYQLILSLYVDFCFANDPKVQAKKWVIENVSPDKIIHTHNRPAYVGLHLPSNYRVVDVSQFANPVIPLDSLKTFLTEYAKNGPDYIITPGIYKAYHSKKEPRYERGPIADYYKRLVYGSLGYNLAASFENEFPIKMGFLNPINRRLEIYKKSK